MALTYISHYGVLFIVAGSFALDTSQGISNSWKMEHDWKNYVETSTISWEKNDYRLIECAVHCGQDPWCFSFFHHPSLQTCLGLKSYKCGLPVNQTTQQGWNYYTQTQHCVGDYAYNNNLGLCYKLYDTELEYLEARLFCERDRAKLVIINTPAELQYFAGILGELRLTWVGLQRTSDTSSIFKWWNGQVASDIAWSPGYPKDGDDSAVLLFNGTYLNKSFSTGASTALCQKII